MLGFGLSAGFRRGYNDDCGRASSVGLWDGLHVSWARFGYRGPLCTGAAVGSGGGSFITDGWTGGLRPTGLEAGSGGGGRLATVETFSAFCSTDIVNVDCFSVVSSVLVNGGWIRRAFVTLLHEFFRVGTLLKWFVTFEWLWLTFDTVDWLQDILDWLSVPMKKVTSSFSSSEKYWSNSSCSSDIDGIRWNGGSGRSFSVFFFGKSFKFFRLTAIFGLPDEFLRTALPVDIDLWLLSWLKSNLGAFGTTGAVLGVLFEGDLTSFSRFSNLVHDFELSPTFCVFGWENDDFFMLKSNFSGTVTDLGCFDFVFCSLSAFAFVLKPKIRVDFFKFGDWASTGVARWTWAKLITFGSRFSTNVSCRRGWKYVDFVFVNPAVVSSLCKLLIVNGSLETRLWVRGLGIGNSALFKPLFWVDSFSLVGLELSSWQSDVTVRFVVTSSEEISSGMDLVLAEWLVGWCAFLEVRRLCTDRGLAKASLELVLALEGN